MIEGPKYPDVHVRLIGEDGNAFAIVGRVQKAMRSSGISEDEIDLFRREAFAGNYDQLLQTCLEWVDVEVGTGRTVRG
jgi:hypothetical protein